MIMNKINKLDFNKKEVVKTMLNIVKKDDLKNRVWMDFGFFDNPKDFQKFKKYLTTEFLQLLLDDNRDFKFNNWSGDNNDLINRFVWICWDDCLNVYSFEDVKKLINDFDDCSDEYYRLLFNGYENTINNLLRLSLNY